MDTTQVTPTQHLPYTDDFVRRHIGPSGDEVDAMLQAIGVESLETLMDNALPLSIRMKGDLAMAEGMSEYDMLAKLRTMADKNQVWRSYIGMGYHGTIVPPVIQRNILENPGWYTQYTPYQAEIAQGRLEALLNYQTLISDLTALPCANASLLDEGTAVAEAMSLCFNVNRKSKSNRFFISERCHPQTIEVARTRADALDIEIVVGDHRTVDLAEGEGFRGAVVQYPDTYGAVENYSDWIETAHGANTLVIVAADLMSLLLLEAPGVMGADVAVGSAQRFGVPMGYGGPHAAYMATRDEYKRQIPGRIVGVTKDRNGNNALRLALQTREQHIRREKATSNICTAQVLLAIMSAMYAVYHGPDGLRNIATRVHKLTTLLALGLERLGATQVNEIFFDTLCVEVGAARQPVILSAAAEKQINLRAVDDTHVGISLDETVDLQDIDDILSVFSEGMYVDFSAGDLLSDVAVGYAPELARKGTYLEHPVFNSYHSETEFLRYVTRLQSRDLSLNTSMISLGSCTMKLNATAEMMPVTWPEWGGLHPFAPREQAEGYTELFEDLKQMLCEITGFDAVSLQPNAGSQGEYSGMLVIRAYHEANGESHRNICLIPSSAHGTNPASAVMAGMKVVVVKCDNDGNIDLEDLKAKCEKHKEHLAAIMVTYPSTHGVFEEAIQEVCDVVHEHGGQVYLDGANLNAQVGYCRPGDYGADVCHMNLHKTFCIPHGGGGPGMGPIGVVKHLAPFLPGHPIVPTGGEQAIGPIAAAPWGSPSILLISYAYILMMGGEGLKRASAVAVLNANYMAHRLAPYYPIVYRGLHGLAAHEFILDMRGFKQESGVEVEDIAKRLMDYGYHAPTISWPVIGTMMIEPTESESQAELDRFCDAMIAIHGEIKQIADGTYPKDDNPLVNAPHTGAEATADEWTHPYSRTTAVYPASWLYEHKFWPAVSRADNVYGDRHLMCTCPPLDTYA
ncbi:MAG: aminomethyl-transferring glycine dehydrogenase [Planctomycetota bacterium]|nr:aminomethyl-transferring glycine dehydrogenase [Planctomycetota bacterium]